MLFAVALCVVLIRFSMKKYVQLRCEIWSRGIVASLTTPNHNEFIDLPSKQSISMKLLSPLLILCMPQFLGLSLQYGDSCH